MTLTLTILGCGSSGGVPRPVAGWGACDPHNPKNRRRRCSILLEKTAPTGRTVVVVDTPPVFPNLVISAQITVGQTLVFLLGVWRHRVHWHK